MIEKLRKERKTIWHISIVLMMMLVVVFLVAPASAVTCAPKYSASVKVIDDEDTGIKERLVLTYRIPVVPVVMLRVYVQYERTITSWHYERTSTPRTWCPNNHRCEVSGDPVVITGRTGVTYGPWRPTGYYTTET
jgi:heme/copper-type cytochrome/quinol oxidase subunit 2